MLKERENPAGRRGLQGKNQTGRDARSIPELIAHVNTAALQNLPALLENLFPVGKLQGNEYLVGDLAGNPGRSLSINAASGVWRDFATNEGGSDPVSLYAAAKGVKQSEAARAIAEILRLDVSPRPAAGSAKPSRRIMASYDYHDAAGEVVFQVTRWEPKSFSQRRPDGNGGWINNMQGVVLVPFNLPAVLCTEDEVFITEGEKDALALGKLGLVATTNAQGAGKWREEYGPHFRGKHVVILPDNDEPGRAHAEAVAKHLHGVAASVKVIELPGLPVKGDVSDWLAVGGKLGTLLEIVDNAPAWVPTGSEEECPGASHIEDLLDASAKWPEMRPAAYAGIAGDFVELATRNSEADPVAVLMTFLVRFAAEVGSGPHMYVGDGKHYARLFCAIVGRTAKARKGTSAKPVKRLFCDFPEEGYVPGSTSPGPLSTGEGLVFAVRDEVKVWQVDKKTGEGKYVVTDPGVEDKRLYVQDEELAAALQCTKRDGNTLSANLRTLWDEGTTSPLTKSIPIRCTGAHVNLLCHITEPELHCLLGHGELSNGFANRFLWTCVRRQKMVPRPAPMPDGELAFIRGQVLDRAQAAQRVGRMHLNEHAKQYFDGIYAELSQDTPGLAGAVVDRAEAQVLRLAMVYALLDGVSTIDVAHLESARAVWDYCRASAMRIFAIHSGNPVEGKIVEALTLHESRTTSELYKDLGNHVSRDDMAVALKTLVDSGRVVMTEEKTKGRPRKAFSLATLAKKAKKAKKGTATRETSQFQESHNPYELSEESEVGINLSHNRTMLNSHNSLNSQPSEERKNGGFPSSKGLNSLNSLNSQASPEKCEDADFWEIPSEATT